MTAEADAFERLARQARDELQRPAPPDALAGLARRRRAQSRRRAAAVGAVVVVVAAGAVALRSGDGPVVGPATPPAPARVAPSTTVAAVDSLRIADSGRAVGGAEPSQRLDDPRAALLTTSALGAEWFALPERADAVPKDLTVVAASLPACRGVAPVQGTLLDAPRAVAVFNNLRSQPFAQTVYVFGSRDAASAALDLLSDRDWHACWLALVDALGPLTDPYAATVTSRGMTLEPPDVHGERQVSYARDLSFGASNGRRVVGVRFQVYVQIGRAIVQVDPIPDTADASDPDGLVERVVAAATASLRAALVS